MKVYDVFGMIPPPGEQDGEDVHERYEKIAGGEAKGVGGETYYGYRDDLYEEVTESFARLGVPVDEHNVELIRGLFEDTIELDEPVAFAHLDGDWYESTMTCLTRIAPLLVAGRPDRARRLRQVVRLPDRGRRVLRRPARASGSSTARSCTSSGRRTRERGSPAGCPRRSQRAARKLLPAPPAGGDTARDGRGGRAAVRGGGARKPRGGAARPRAVARARPRARRAAGTTRSSRRSARSSAAREHAAAQAVATSLRAQPDTETLGRVTSGIVAFKRGYRALAWDELRGVSRETWARRAPAEYVRAGLAVAPGRDARGDPRARRRRPRASGREAGTRSSPRSSATATSSSRARCSRSSTATSATDPPWAARARSRLAAALGRRRRRLAHGAGAGRRPPHGRDHGLRPPAPTKASANIGDHVQSIAALGHLVRHQRRPPARPRGPRRAARAARGPAPAPSAGASGIDADLEVITVHRDASMYQPIPRGHLGPRASAGTCTRCSTCATASRCTATCGRSSSRSTATSATCSRRRRSSTSSATGRSAAATGRPSTCCCRRRAGVLLRLRDDDDRHRLPRRSPRRRPDAPLAYVDVPAADVPRGGVTYKHSRPAVRRTLVRRERLHARSTCSRPTGASTAASSRRGCTATCRSARSASPSSSSPRNRSDVRFDGLIDIDDDAFDAIRAGLLEQARARSIGAILGGAPEAGRLRALARADRGRCRCRRGAARAAARGSRRSTTAVASQVERAVARATRARRRARTARSTARSCCPRAAA